MGSWRPTIEAAGGSVSAMTRHTPVRTPLELRHLRYFRVLAEELHFGRAADIACITQSALSQQISRLEAILGVTLLTRSPRGVELTPAGKALSERLDDIFGRIDGALKASRTAGQMENYALSVGLVEYTNLPFIPHALAKLQALYPAVNVQRHEMNARRQIDALASREIDIGFGVPVGPLAPQSEIEARSVFRSGWSVLMMTNHALASRLALHASDLDGVRLIVPARSVNEPIYDGLLGSFARSGISPNIVYETMQSQVGIAMVRQGVGLMLSAAYVFAEVPQGLVARAVDGFDPLDIHLFIRSDESRPLTLDFADLAIEQAARFTADGMGGQFSSD
jgi:DNA-binding transcriptional LysR family regulator